MNPKLTARVFGLLASLLSPKIEEKPRAVAVGWGSSQAGRLCQPSTETQSILQCAAANFRLQSPLHMSSNNKKQVAILQPRTLILMRVLAVAALLVAAY